MGEEEKEKLRLEQEELNRLIEKGYDFTVSADVVVHRRGFLGISRKVVERKEQTFSIQEPTLSTLDRLSAEFLQFAIDEAEVKEGGLEAIKRYANKHALRLAKILALAVLGEEYLIPKPSSRGFSYRKDEKRLGQLTSIFARSIKPSKLYSLTVALNAMCNFGDFMSSIRLLSAERTTAPIRIEGEKVD